MNTSDLRVATPTSQPGATAAQTPPTQPAPSKRSHTPLLIAFLIAAAGVAAMLSRRSSDGESEAAPTATPTQVVDASRGPVPSLPEVPKPAASEPVPSTAAVAPSIAPIDVADAAVQAPAPEPSHLEPRSTIKSQNEGQPRERTRTRREQVVKPADVEPREKSSGTEDDGLSNFGGRR